MCVVARVPVRPSRDRAMERMDSDWSASGGGGRGGRGMGRDGLASAGSFRGGRGPEAHMMAGEREGKCIVECDMGVGV